MSSSDGTGAFFGALPLRAIGDRRLTALELRVLGAVAFHDRMSLCRGKGAGCFASNKVIADECGANSNSVSTAINKLDQLGYVQIERPRSKHGSRKIRVVYDQRRGESQLRHDFEKIPTNHSLSENKHIPRSGKKNSGEPAQRDARCAEAKLIKKMQAILDEGDAYVPGIGGLLSQLERAFKKNNSAFNDHMVEKFLALIATDDEDKNDRTKQRAFRMLCSFGYRDE